MGPITAIGRGRGERQHAVVPEQDQAVGGDRPRQFDLLVGAAVDAGPVHVDERLLEQTEPELGGEHACDGLVDIGHLELSGGERGAQRLVVAVGARELDVDPGVQRRPRLPSAGRR